MTTSIYEQPGYHGWLNYSRIEDEQLRAAYANYGSSITVLGDSPILQSAAEELTTALASLLGLEPVRRESLSGEGIQGIVAGTRDALKQSVLEGTTKEELGDEGYEIRTVDRAIVVSAEQDKGVLYAVFHLLRLIQTGESISQLQITERPLNKLRMINHWDNMDGSIERGYAGRSIFFNDYNFRGDSRRLKDYARLLASVGLNAATINNVNVHRIETQLITERYLQDVAQVAEQFRAYGIQLYLSINYAAPIELGELDTADPLDPDVKAWWGRRCEEIYRHIPDFGGFLVKADSEFRPGPFTYGRDHADGANMLADAIAPYGGQVIWRCFVYNCLQDWRDRTTDRARAAYDHFMPLDGKFRNNVLLQIKNGPMDFQVREPVSPLFGGLEQTQHLLELQITQEYTGQQRHLFYLVPQWKTILDFDTHARGTGSTVAEAASGRLFGQLLGGIAAVTSIGDDANWTGHGLAQANLYGYGRLTWNPATAAEEIASHWIRMTFGADAEVERVITDMLLASPDIYESYTAPLGVGWMVNPNHHYGPNVDGYEYAKWGTYHFADCHGIGVDRTVESGTGYVAQYHEPWSKTYSAVETCPDELLLFFHHVPYRHKLHSGKTVIQHIYDTHFEGAEKAAGLLEQWDSLRDRMEPGLHAGVRERLAHQAKHACEWRDQINTYFTRKSGIADEQGRTIF
ncbi:alpha-glucuronidase family glycosyl hydrolase [Paenibacillus daejeonensis]|uniref:alpha-glucuronidase family glycosyl hydrolase n=1 Tax=Paenibacillus daejeonensis TaxID=135193 RepID=UPI00036DB438|nr:alpha-glucuronidase family glycosyl hydrolase [Paenibacillus daejeonensis]